MSDQEAAIDAASASGSWTTEEMVEQLAELVIGENDPVAIDIHYCNPDAKIVLISKDRVAVRVGAWHMSRQRLARASTTPA